jgi:hypothetical protein
VSFSFAGTMPTGGYKNGSLAPSVSPTLCAGKGFRRFDVQSMLGAVLPTDDTPKIGRTLVWNTVGQYHIAKLFWPEVESNASFFYGGPNDGRVQSFITPGLMVSRFKLENNPRNRLAFLFGGGMQIATTQYHAYNHALIVSTRMLF